MHFLRRVSELFRSVHSERPRRAVFALRCRTRRSVEVDVVVLVELEVVDVLVLFESEGRPLGRGIAIEAQHANHGKDVDAVESDYEDAGLSVAWLDSDDFENGVVDRVDVNSTRHRIRSKFEWLGIVGRLKSQGPDVDIGELADFLGCGEEWCRYRIAASRFGSHASADYSVLEVRDGVVHYEA